MRVTIASERLLFRFGLDRVLLVLARMLRSRGHQVTLLANRLDAKAAAQVADHVVTVPVGPDYLALNEFTATELEANWQRYFPEGFQPDLVLVGGWPFFASIPVFRAHGVRTAFLDCGAVPTEGMPDAARITQERLRAMRRENLPLADAIIAISKFIEHSQSRVDAPALMDVRALLLGGDHLASSEWTVDLVDITGSKGAGLAAANRAHEAGNTLLLNLGRWEPGCYKGSEALFDVMRALRGRKIVAVVLGEAKDVAVPADLVERVIPIGHPDDRELAEIIGLCAAGVSVSTWEGFNLPVAELQWQGKPAFALEVGAHPEVVCDPWFLVPDYARLASRIGEFIDRGVPPSWKSSLERFRRDFAWRVNGERYLDALEEIGARRPPRTILVDATNACLDPANSGVMRVVRRGTRALQDAAEVLFAVWCADRQTYVWPTAAEYRVLSTFNGPRIGAELPRSPDGGRVTIDETFDRLRRASTWLLLGETVLERRAKAVRDWARAHRVRIAAIFYDAIPVLRPDLVADSEIRNNHADYMRGLSHCDAILTISRFSADCLERFWAESGCRWSRVTPCLLPEEMGGTPRARASRMLARNASVKILCVSTLEPRKGHLNLLEAMRRLSTLHPLIDWTLTLVGNRYAGGGALALAVETACAADPRIRWLGIVDDERLNTLYAGATFTVYGSTIEGYGMPIVESLWHGVPCICHNDGVMAELAAEGGCLATDMADPEAIAEAIARLSTKPDLYNELVRQALARTCRTWQDYSGEIMNTLEEAEQRPARSEDWEQRLYSGCLTAEWQMMDSERLALTGLLHRHKPRLAIEIGTYRGGSLSLISQYAKNVISIDIDPAIPERYSHFKNVRFLTGFSHEVLPPLLDELEKSAIAVDFVLIDGDHSAAGVKRDIELVISRTPRAPMFIMMHDGFNPECRRGMLAADWSSSPHVRWVDTDFIPGRVIEAGAGAGEMWGGLACAYLTPEPREGPLAVRTTASGMWRELKERHYGEA